MKFNIKSIAGSKMRKGTLTDFERLPGLSLATPLLLLYTKSGSVPHMTHEVLQYLTTEFQAVQITLPTTFSMTESVTEFGKGISTFVGLQDYFTYFSVQDPANKTPEGYNKKEEISIWTNTGRAGVDANRYMDTVEAFQPDMYQGLSNSDTNFDSSEKRVNTVMESSRNLFDQCLKRHSLSNALKGSSLLAVVEGGYNIAARKKSILSSVDLPVKGYVIGGFHSNGPEVAEMDFDKVKNVLDATMEYFPNDKFRILHGCWSPQNVLTLVTLGIDVFDSSYPFLVTERMNALVFQYETVDPEKENSQPILEPSIEISLNDSKYSEDFTAVVDKCTCLTCVKHTKAYIYHLIRNKELLASTLLMLYQEMIKRHSPNISCMWPDTIEAVLFELWQSACSSVETENEKN